ncbi:hypothetical protein [Yoonia rosea]|uniref:hypothetical protein n=1 Tax=Yoonia rosea TaxID=287098 RepID=UPI0013F5B926|nr:hypothetical protein [Yoonia rosea]
MKLETPAPTGKLPLKSRRTGTQHTDQNAHQPASATLEGGTAIYLASDAGRLHHGPDHSHR